MADGVTLIVSDMVAELDFLREKSHTDDKMIELLKEQNKILADDSSLMSARHAEETRVMKQRLDEAVRNEQEVLGILNVTVNGLITSLRKRAGDRTPDTSKPSTNVEAVPMPQGPEPVRLAPPLLRDPPGFSDDEPDPNEGSKYDELTRRDDDNLRSILARLPAPQLNLAR